MAKIEILVGDHFELARYKIIKYLADLFPENTPERGDHLMDLYELLDQCQWEEKKMVIPCETYSKYDNARWVARNIRFSMVNFTIDPDTMTVSVG